MAVSREVASYQGQQEIVDAINGFTLSGVAQKAVWFDSVSSMQRADIPAGATAATRGYTTVNDGGNAFYYIREKTQSDVEDGGSIIFLDNENVAECIDLNIPRTFDTVADLKNASLFVGLKVSTKGFYAIKDGGGASYYIRNKSTATVSVPVIENNTRTNVTVVFDDYFDGTIVHVLDNEKVAEMIPCNSQINVKQFGCKGDGVTDDSDLLQKTINYCAANKYVVFLSKGVYAISKTLYVFENNTEIVGVSPENSACSIRYTGDTPANIIHADGTLSSNSNGYIYRCKFDNFSIANYGAVGSVGIYENHVSETVYSNILFAGVNEFECFMHLNPSGGICKFDWLAGTGARYGLKLNSITSAWFSNLNLFACSDASILATGVNAVSFINVWTEWFKNIIKVDNSLGSSGFVNSVFENFLGANGNADYSNNKLIDVSPTVREDETIYTNMIYFDEVLCSNWRFDLYHNDNDNLITIHTAGLGNRAIHVTFMDVNITASVSISSVIHSDWGTNYINIDNIFCRAAGSDAIELVKGTTSYYGFKNVYGHIDMQASSPLRLPRKISGKPFTVTGSENGDIFVDTNNKLYFHDGTSFRQIPYRYETTINNSSATDVATLKTDFNNLLGALKNCGVLK